jgi:hypothetical protein
MFPSAGSSKTWVPTSIVRTSNYIGRSNWAADNYFSGTLSEILVYNVAFNTTQRVILENYLSAAWGEKISTSRYTPPSPTSVKMRWQQLIDVDVAKADHSRSHKIISGF